MVEIKRGKTYFKKEKESSKLRMGGNSWSINLDRVDLSEIENICYVTSKSIYEISSLDAIAHGFERVLGGERKLIVPIKYWKKS